MREKIKLLLPVFLFVFLFNIKCYAADVRVLSINGGDTKDDNSFLYSASMFYDCIDGLYVNNIKVKTKNCHYFKDPSYSQLDKLITSSFRGAKNNDISIFYYSGHGTVNESNGHRGIYTSDGDNYEFSTLYRKLNAISGRKLVILDCCYSGAFLTQNAIDTSRFTVLTACEWNTYSPFYNRISLLSLFKKKNVNMTRFSNALLTGMGYFGKQKADTNKDKTVTTDELYDYLQKNYAKTYSAIAGNGQEVSFKAEPQKRGNVSFSFSKTVVKPASIKLNKSSASITAGKAVQLKATVTGASKKVSWSTSNKKIATVTSSGKVTGKKAGSVTITAKANGKTAKCKITVKKEATKAKKTLSKKEQHKLYERIISAYSKKMKAGAAKWNESTDLATYFAFVDIDKNGVDELIVRAESTRLRTHTTASTSGYGENAHIYTISNNKVKKVFGNSTFNPVLGHMNYVHIYKGCEYVDRGFSHWPPDYIFYNYKDGILSSSPTYWITAGGPDVWGINGKRVSKNECVSLLDQISSSRVGYAMHKYTAATYKHYI